ncbi:BZ3500_MvSof-1268-A1-R1_Chr6-3g08674 [Microbotryum saponariae]|uniref:BZ3500_MvSof-1268-A1-R1_Chr6-3g08674 protein n=1 Tax=Microbotryum saponariae TaxID=289078 RepID=A0A2X0KJ50_9BASI|nr:BZ3500_MvSof-1268-A1-R1_Chr6-3g08674 [Microbotryum saponariae]SDA07275.1 BZ3501_MvSof-1269-A2-R1_Chr6-2g08377 [Microbotryum saponariae]
MSANDRNNAQYRQSSHRIIPSNKFFDKARTNYKLGTSLVDFHPSSRPALYSPFLQTPVALYPRSFNPAPVFDPISSYKFSPSAPREVLQFPRL